MKVSISASVDAGRILSREIATIMHHHDMCPGLNDSQLPTSPANPFSSCIRGSRALANRSLATGFVAAVATAGNRVHKVDGQLTSR